MGLYIPSIIIVLLISFSFLPFLFKKTRARIKGIRIGRMTSSFVILAAAYGVAMIKSFDWILYGAITNSQVVLIYLVQVLLTLAVIIPLLFFFTAFSMKNDKRA